MTELYRSFEGKLNVETQHGYIIYDNKETYEIEWVSIESVSSHRCRIPKTLLTEEDFPDIEKIAELDYEIGNGVYKNGQTFYKNKWYSGTTITDIQNSNKDNNWKKYIK